MNYYQYKRRAPRSKATDFIKPFLVIVIFIAVIFAGWRLLSSTLVDGGESLSSEKVFLDIETGSAKAMTASDNEWKNVPTGIYLYEGEKLKTMSDGRVTLGLFNQDTMRLDKSTEVKFAGLNRDAVGGQASMTLEDGKLWVIIDKNSPTVSEFKIDTGLLKLKSSGGTFAVTHPGMLYVLDGSVKVEIMHEGSIVKTASIGVGQELIVDEAIAADLSEDLTKEVIFALDDAFKSSNWYRWNQQQEGAVELDGDEEMMTDEEEATDETTEDETMTDEDAAMEEDTTTSDEEEDEDEAVDPTDNEPPAVPEIETPGNNGDTITLDSVEQDIKGSVSSDTYVVIVNDYRLSKYVPGSKAFRYTAKVDFGNLEVGENEYEVIAEDKNGNQSEAATITLVLPQDVYDEVKADDEEEDTTATETTTTPEASSSGGVSITSPNNGENLTTSETAFEIKGTVPAATAKVIVNDYTLGGYSAGDTTYLYRANSTLGTLEIGALNTYKVTAYDADDEVLGTASMTIDVESGSNGEGAPVITMPTTTGNYETTLDQLVIGGSVGKWITRVRIDGANLDSYIPGSEEWKKTVTLNPGENSYNICVEKEGEEQGCSSITIQYNN